MYNREEIIRIIGYENWEDFDIFMSARNIDYDEDGEEIYYWEDLDEFKLQHNIR